LARFRRIYLFTQYRIERSANPKKKENGNIGEKKKEVNIILPAEANVLVI
jgi:hypothetical protein